MNNSHPNDPLHGITLKTILTELVERHGWKELGERIPVRCFIYDPSIKSSLTFLRKTPWARQKIEELYLYDKKIEQYNNAAKEIREDNQTGSLPPSTTSMFKGKVKRR